MIKSQVIVLEVFFESEVDDPAKGEKLAPQSWRWDELIDEPVRGHRVLAAGEVVDYPTPAEAVALS